MDLIKFHGSLNPKFLSARLLSIKVSDSMENNIVGASVRPQATVGPTEKFVTLELCQCN